MCVTDSFRASPASSSNTGGRHATPLRKLESSQDIRRIARTCEGNENIIAIDFRAAQESFQLLDEYLLISEIVTDAGYDAR